MPKQVNSGNGDVGFDPLTVFATDDVGGTAYPISKLDVGALGASVPVSAANPLPVTTVAAITGFALEAGHLATIDTNTAKIPAQGQALAAASTPVVLPAAQITTLTPPAAIAGFALEAGHLATIDSHIPAQGQALAAASTPVVLTAAQITTLTPPAAIAGFALEAGHLATIDTSTAKIPAQGQALAAASTPVVLTAVQVAALTPPAAITGFALEAGHLATIDTSTAKIPSAVAKGTQGATATPVQNLKDSGRNQTNYFMAVPILTTVAEVMMSLTGYKGGVAVAANVSPAVVTVAKTYRIQSITITYFNVLVLGSVRVTLRANLTGAGVIGSPLVGSWQCGLSGDGASTVGHLTTYSVPIPDGMEFAAGTGIAIGIQGEGAVPTTATIVGYAKVEILGYEY